MCVCIYTYTYIHKHICTYIINIYVNIYLSIYLPIYLYQSQGNPPGEPAAAEQGSPPPSSGLTRICRSRVTRGVDLRLISIDR